VNRHARFIVLTLAAVAAACGSKGPPLAPLRPVPAPPTEFAAQRVGDRVTLRFVVPSVSQDPTQPLSLARVDVYAVTMPLGAEPPTLEQLVRRDALVGSVDVRPPAPTVDPAVAPPAPPVPSVPPAPPDPRPAPGEIAAWSETVSAGATRVMPLTRAQQARAARRRPVWVPLAPTGLIVPFFRVTLPTRYYVAVGVSDRSRNGPASTVLALPFRTPPDPPATPQLSNDETLLVLTWTTRQPGAPVTVVETSSTGAERPVPVSAAPITTGSWSTPVAFGVERCFVVRGVLREGFVSTESQTVGPVCGTPKDTFPPPAPAGLVDAGGAEVTLLWDAVTTPDLAGYHVLRGEGAGEMRRLEQTPTTRLQYIDRTARAGVRYVYTVVAVDASGNASPPSNRVTVERVAATGRENR
jgi:predicted small lipoprotein YifL